MPRDKKKKKKKKGSLEEESSEIELPPMTKFVNPKAELQITDPLQSSDEEEEEEVEEEPPMELFGKSMLMFEPDSEFRQWCYRTIYNDVCTGFLVSLVVINLFFMAYNRPGMDETMYTALLVVSLIVNIVFTIEMMMRIVVLGFANNQNSYMSDPWNLFDIVLIVTIWTSSITGWLGISDVAERWSFAFSILRSLRVIRFFAGMREIMAAIAGSMSMAGTVGALFLFMFMTFAVMGREMFGGMLTRTCAVTGSPDKHGVPYQVSESCPHMLGCQARGLDCVLVNINASRAETTRADHVDKYGFDNVVLSFFTLTAILAQEDWPVLCNALRRVDSSTSVFVWPVFAMLIGLLSLVVVNLFLAAITHTYADLRKAKKQGAGFVSDVELAQMQRLLELKQTDFLELERKAAADKRLRAPRTERLGGGGRKREEHIAREVSRGNELFAKQQREEEAKEIEPSAHDLNDVMEQFTKSFDVSISEEMEEFLRASDSGEISGGLRAPMIRLVQNTRFSFLVLVIVTTNVTLMAIEHHSMDPWLVTTMFVADIIFTVFYAFEMVVKMIAMKTRAYLTDPLNTLDAITVALSLISYVFMVLLTSDSAQMRARALAAVRVLRVARLIKVLRLIRVLREQLAVAFASTGALMDLFCFAMFVFVLMAMIGVQLFEPCHTDSQFVVRRTNYGTFSFAFMAVFQIASSDSWTDIMFTYMECTDWTFTFLYHFFIFTFANIILLNVLIAIFLENYELSDEQKREHQVQEYNAKEDTLSPEDMQVNEIEVVHTYDSDEEPGSPEDDDQGAAAGGGGCCTCCKPERNYALCCLHEGNPLRIQCKALAASVRFEQFIIMVVLLSCACLAIEGPPGKYPRDTMHGKAFYWIDLGAFAIFLLELLIKLLAYGFVFTPEAYLADNWNKLDLFVVLASGIDLILKLAKVKAEWASACRLLRVLRPMRLVNFIPGMKVVLSSCIKCIPIVSTNFGLMLIMMVIYSIVGVRLFGGLMWACTADFSLDRAACVAAGLRWERLPYHFDNLWGGIQALFVVTTTQGWMIIYEGMCDTSVADAAPAENANRLIASIFCVSFVFINAFILAKLFVGVLVDLFMHQSGQVWLTEPQHQWYHLTLLMYRIKPDSPMPKSPWRHCAHSIAKSDTFAMLVNSFVVMNVAITLSISPNLSPLVMRLCNHGNLICLVVYTVEMLVKLVGTGCQRYFKGNLLDFAICTMLWICTLLDLLRAYPEYYESIQWLDFIQAFQFLRVVKLVNLLMRNDALSKLFMTIELSVAQIVNVSLLTLMFFFIFGVTGMKLCGAAPHSVGVAGVELDGLDNFENVFSSMMFLFQFSTGGSMTRTLEICAEQTGPLMYVFFMVFFILVNFVMLNLFTAVMLEHFDFNMNTDFAIGADDLNVFVKQWRADGFSVPARLDLGDAMSPRDRALKIYLRDKGHAMGEGDEDMHDKLAKRKRSHRKRSSRQAEASEDHASDEDVEDANPLHGDGKVGDDDESPPTPRTDDDDDSGDDDDDDDEADDDEADSFGAGDYESGKTAISIVEVQSFVERLSEKSDVFRIITSTDPQWYHRMLMELNLSFGLDSEHTTIGFFDLLLSTCRLAFPASCLPYQEEIGLEFRETQQRTIFAYRVMRIFMACKKAAKNVPKGKDPKRWRAAMRVVRLWALSNACKRNKVSAEHSKDEVTRLLAQRTAMIKNSKRSILTPQGMMQRADAVKSKLQVSIETANRLVMMMNGDLRPSADGRDENLGSDSDSDDDGLSFASKAAARQEALREAQVKFT